MNIVKGGQNLKFHYDVIKQRSLIIIITRKFYLIAVFFGKFCQNYIVKYHFNNICLFIMIVKPNHIFFYIIINQSKTSTLGYFFGVHLFATTMATRHLFELYFFRTDQCSVCHSDCDTHVHVTRLLIDSVVTCYFTTMVCVFFKVSCYIPVNMVCRFYVFGLLNLRL